MGNRLILGNPGWTADYSAPEILRFEPKDGAFTYLVTYLTALHGFVALDEVYQPSGKGIFPWAEDDVSLFDSVVMQRRLVLSPHEIINAMVQNYWPSKVEFTCYPIRGSPRGETHLGVIGPFIFCLGQTLLTNFFENRHEFLSEAYGSRRSWPAVWQFARIVRNATSHGGVIDIRDGDEVEWRGLRYCPSDNGKPIINTDILPADLFLLVKDMETALHPPEDQA